MGLLRIALLQMTGCGWDQPANLQKGEAFCRVAAGLGADIALFPEMWNVGYQLPAPGDEAALARWRAQASGPEDGFYRHFQALAAELQLAIALTYLERWPGAPRNTLTLFDHTGRPVLNYAKVHTCAFDREAALTPGEGFAVCTLETRAGPLQVGAMICFDREFPESARILMLQGAELVLTPNACELESLRAGQFQARAFENMLALALCNYAAPQENGGSLAYDGMAFTPDGRPRSMLLVQAGPAEGVYLATLDLDALRAYRAGEVWGNAYRHPGCYAPLVERGVQPPFLRPEAK